MIKYLLVDNERGDGTHKDNPLFSPTAITVTAALESYVDSPSYHWGVEMLSGATCPGYQVTHIGGSAAPYTVQIPYLSEDAVFKITLRVTSQEGSTDVSSCRVYVNKIDRACPDPEKNEVFFCNKRRIVCLNNKVDIDRHKWARAAELGLIYGSEVVVPNINFSILYKFNGPDYVLLEDPNMQYFTLECSDFPIAITEEQLNKGLEDFAIKTKQGPWVGGGTGGYGVVYTTTLSSAEFLELYPKPEPQPEPEPEPQPEPEPEPQPDPDPQPTPDDNVLKDIMDRLKVIEQTVVAIGAGLTTASNAWGTWGSKAKFLPIDYTPVPDDEEDPPANPNSATLDAGLMICHSPAWQRDIGIPEADEFLEKYLSVIDLLNAKYVNLWIHFYLLFNQNKAVSEPTRLHYHKLISALKDREIKIIAKLPTLALPHVKGVPVPLDPSYETHLKEWKRLVEKCDSEFDFFGYNAGNEPAQELYQLDTEFKHIWESPNYIHTLSNLGRMCRDMILTTREAVGEDKIVTTPAHISLRWEEGINLFQFYWSNYPEVHEAVDFICFNCYPAKRHGYDSMSDSNYRDKYFDLVKVARSVSKTNHRLISSETGIQNTWEMGLGDSALSRLIRVWNIPNEYFVPVYSHFILRSIGEDDKWGLIDYSGELTFQVNTIKKIFNL